MEVVETDPFRERINREPQGTWRRSHNMSLLERLRQTNVSLPLRVEAASGYSPLCDLGDEAIGAIMREAASARQWQDVPEAHRHLVEQAEAKRESAALQPVPFLGKA